MENHNKEVRFDIFCKYCRYRNKKDDQEPCTDCLNHPAQEDTHHPALFKKEKPMVYFFEPDDKTYTLDLKKAHNWDEMPTDVELKKYFLLIEGDWFEKELHI